MTLFETDKKRLTYLLDQIEPGDLAIPDFQRSFVWDSGATLELVASVARCKSCSRSLAWSRFYP
jgi:hypothetical protein